VEYKAGYSGLPLAVTISKLSMRLIENGIHIWMLGSLKTYFCSFSIDMDLFSSLEQFEFCAFASGSSGNCYYIGHPEGALLIDMGLSARKIQRNLKRIGKNLSDIHAVLVTHDHIDHIRAAESITKDHRIPVYATKGTQKGMLSNRFTAQSDTSCFYDLTPDKSLFLAGFRILPFSISHDAEESVGFFIQNSHKRFCLATDLGFINETAAFYLKSANIIVLESNYDEQMLANGPYPLYLQQRIKSERGHLSNVQAAQFLSEHWHDAISHVFLAHLSKQNNTSETALKTLFDQLKTKGITLNSTIHISALERTIPSPFFRLDGN